jgi:hypothetical protein
MSAAESSEAESARGLTSVEEKSPLISMTTGVVLNW